MTFKNWLNYFEKNKKHFDHVDWSTSDRISLKEKEVIISSIQQFQKGENSEGKNLINFAQESNLPDYLETIKLFIKEEQKHALVLGELMRLNGISKIKEHWIDSVFRGIRKLSTLENSIVVLLTAEVIAAVYYDALSEATNSKTLKSICQQILEDEEMHINFQSFTLYQLYLKRNFVRRVYVRWFHRILMFGTTIVVWLYHMKVLKEGGYNFIKFYYSVFDEFNRSDQMIRGVEPIEIRSGSFSSVTLNKKDSAAYAY